MMFSHIRAAVMGMAREVHRLQIYLKCRVDSFDDGLDVRVRMREVSKLVPKSLARLPGRMESPLTVGSVDFREKTRAQLGTY